VFFNLGPGALSMLHAQRYLNPALHVSLSAVAYAENFHGGGLVDGHMVVICVGLRCL